MPSKSCLQAGRDHFGAACAPTLRAMTHAGPPTGARISFLALCSMALPVFSVSPLLVHPRSAQSLPWRRARGRQKTPSEKNTDAVSSLLAAYPPLANVTAEADMLRTGGGLCATGLARRGVCCAATCATCGGRGCGRPANASGVCCKSSIVAERRSPHARARGTGDSRRSGVDGAASNRATSRACSRRGGRRSSTTTSTTGFSRRRTRRRRRRRQTTTSLSCRRSTPARAGSRRNSRRGNA